LTSPEATDTTCPTNLPPAKLRLVRSFQSTEPPFAQRGPNYWAAHLPVREHWRLFPHFRDSTVYLDIETTGHRQNNKITTIALFDGVTIHTFVWGENLQDFERVINQYEVIVTYNGKSFDIPVIEKEMGLRLDHIHLDLRPLLANLGFSGGLKGCEKGLGLDRGELAGVDGWCAVLLWREFQRTGNRRALETLLAYNIADAVNLEPLLVEVYNRNLAQTPFAGKSLPIPTRPAIPHQADGPLLQRIQSRRTEF
jgi:uncharacterized protein YprB with RNaseH-like and TPR domain